MININNVTPITEAEYSKFWIGKKTYRKQKTFNYNCQFFKKSLKAESLLFSVVKCLQRGNVNFNTFSNLPTHCHFPFWQYLAPLREGEETQVACDSQLLNVSLAQPPVFDQTRCDKAHSSVLAKKVSSLLSTPYNLNISVSLFLTVLKVIR